MQGVSPRKKSALKREKVSSFFTSPGNKSAPRSFVARLGFLVVVAPILQRGKRANQKGAASHNGGASFREASHCGGGSLRVRLYSSLSFTIVEDFASCSASSIIQLESFFIATG